MRVSAPTPMRSKASVTQLTPALMLLLGAMPVAGITATRSDPVALTVDATDDTVLENGSCTLREAIAILTQGRAPLALDCPAEASPENRILFAPALASQTIALASYLPLNNNVQVTMDGSSAPGLVISGGNVSYMFTVYAGSSVTFQHLQIVNGKSAGTDGGALSNGGTLTLIDVTLSNNASSSGGGAIASLGTLNIIRSTLSNNSSTSSGGAIRVINGVLTMIDSTVIDNTGGSGGGVLVNTNASLSLTGSNVSNNHALVNGGAIAAYGHVSIANSTFFGNTAVSDGGAIINNQTTTMNSIVNSTIAGNSAVNGGNLANAGGSLLVKNSIVANSTAGTNCSGTITPDTSSMTWPAGDTTCGASILADPLLGLLQDNGGPSFTMMPGKDSAALEAGNATTCASAPVDNRDQRGVLRPQGVGCDIGAVELVTDRIFADNLDGTPTP